jgi:hypothetical protein
MLFIATSASADTVYWEYVDCDGVRTFTDRDSVPVQYQGEAELHVGGPLSEYERFTVDEFVKTPLLVPTTQAPTSSVAPPVVIIQSSPDPVNFNRYHAEPLYRP